MSALSSHGSSISPAACKPSSNGHATGTSFLINKMNRKDLELMLLILKEAKDGIDLNLLAFWLPVQVYYSDSCPTGLGGYSGDQGHAWHFRVIMTYSSAQQTT
jgi:hypothetical protein